MSKICFVHPQNIRYVFGSSTRTSSMSVEDAPGGGEGSRKECCFELFSFIFLSFRFAFVCFWFILFFMRQINKYYMYIIIMKKKEKKMHPISIDV